MPDTPKADPVRTPSAISRADGLDFLALRQDIVAVYRAAFEGPPYHKSQDEVVGFNAALPRHTAQPGFRAVIATDPAGGSGSGAGVACGFAYGYVCGPGQWWHDSVAAALAQPERVRWLGDAFEVVELAVAPLAQGRGFGSRLHDTLLAGLPQRTALLSTMRGQTVARHLYDRRRWTVLIGDFTFPGTQRSYVIMGKLLGVAG
jgi:ribosomal protein S18 acetylase RimI-like enzyme